MTGEIFFEGAVALLASIGLAAVSWVLLDWIIGAKRRFGIYAGTVIAAGGGVEKLVDALNTVLWRHNALSGNMELLIVDMGMDDQEREYILGVMRRIEGIKLLAGHELSEYIALKFERNKAVLEKLNEQGNDNS